MNERLKKYQLMSPAGKAEILRGSVTMQEDYITDLIRRDAPADVISDAWVILGSLHERIALWTLEAGNVEETEEAGWELG